jgi:hypothetical protein
MKKVRNYILFCVFASVLFTTIAYACSTAMYAVAWKSLSTPHEHKKYGIEVSWNRLFAYRKFMVTRQFLSEPHVYQYYEWSFAEAEIRGARTPQGLAGQMDPVVIRGHAFGISGPAIVLYNIIDLDARRKIIGSGFRFLGSHVLLHPQYLMIDVFVTGILLCLVREFRKQILRILSNFRRARSRAARRCSSCGYDLRGHSSAICPECGTPCDVA